MKQVLEQSFVYISVGDLQDPKIYLYTYYQLGSCRSRYPYTLCWSKYGLKKNDPLFIDTEFTTYPLYHTGYDKFKLINEFLDHNFLIQNNCLITSVISELIRNLASSTILINRINLIYLKNRIGSIYYFKKMIGSIYYFKKRIGSID